MTAKLSASFQKHRSLFQKKTVSFLSRFKAWQNQGLKCCQVSLLNSVVI